MIIYSVVFAKHRNSHDYRFIFTLFLEEKTFQRKHVCCLCKKAKKQPNKKNSEFMPVIAVVFQKVMELRYLLGGFDVDFNIVVTNALVIVPCDIGKLFIC